MKRYFKLFLLILWMALIFYLSNQPASISSNTSNFVSDILFRLFFNQFFNQADFIERYAPFIRKLAHFSEFMILAFLVYINLKEYKVKNILRYTFIISALYAISDEIHQLFVLNRHCSIYDMLIDIAGVILAILLIHLFKR